MSLTGDCNTVAVIFIAAMCVEQAFCAQAVERLSRGDQFVPTNAYAYMLLLPLGVVCGGHAGTIRLTLVARLLTSCAVTS